ncbi:MAG: hypothetical protein K2X82_10030 [Gemmataceae bacterium]|nr:hypothetical protein [Gemmataceae bacterium]
MPFDTQLSRLLEKLEGIGLQSGELFDTEVRERIGQVVMSGFVRNVTGFQLPDYLGMTSDEANAAVRSALREYIDEANAEAVRVGLTQFHDRLAVFQNSSVRTKKTGSDYEEFFGHTPPEYYDINGNVLRLQ